MTRRSPLPRFADLRNPRRPARRRIGLPEIAVILLVAAGALVLARAALATAIALPALTAPADCSCQP